MELVCDSTHRMEAQNVDVPEIGHQTLNVLKTAEYTSF
jgi:hypothetical protein